MKKNHTGTTLLVAILVLAKQTASLPSPSRWHSRSPLTPAAFRTPDVKPQNCNLVTDPATTRYVEILGKNPPC